MKLLTPPTMPWQGKSWGCPNCGGVVEIELQDMRAVPPIKPAIRGGRWEAQVQCPWCRKVQIFREVADR